ncbi:MAG: hypothetical protein JXM70_07565 [Pirellulales bacterium]|nr:hypothetical protein [Pirellulales bacterium]
MRIICGLLGLIYGLVFGVVIGPMLALFAEDGPVWLDNIVKGFSGAATLAAWGLIVGSLAVLCKKPWGTRILLVFSSVFLIAVYLGTAITFWGYVNGHLYVLFITPFLLGLMIVLRWCWLQRDRADFDSPPLPGTKRRGLQFSIRSLLVLILVVAVWFSWRAANLQHARHETEVAVKLVDVADPLDGRVGGSITSVRLNALAGDDHLRLLAEFPMLRFLKIEKSRITDDGLAHLKDSSHLISLELKDVPISDDGLRQLIPLHLRLLTLSGVQVTGPGLAQLGKMDDLKVLLLNLDDTQITDADIEELKAALPNVPVIRRIPTKPPQ